MIVVPPRYIWPRIIEIAFFMGCLDLIGMAPPIEYPTENDKFEGLASRLTAGNRK